MTGEGCHFEKCNRATLKAEILNLYTTVQAMSDAKRHYFNLPDRREELPFSDGVLIGDTLYLSGRIGIDPKTGYAPADIDQEISFLLDGIKAVLEHAGMEMNDLVYVQIFCPDLSLFDQFNRRYRTYFSGKLPARAFIGSGALLRNGRFEIMAQARKL
jgi:enamine deaminase RidA (YjgF/YER057c/UK114 family)